MLMQPAQSTLFPYTTLFRSTLIGAGAHLPPAASPAGDGGLDRRVALAQDRKSTRLNSSHVRTSYAVFYLKKKRQGAQKAAVAGLPNRGGARQWQAARADGQR